MSDECKLLAVAIGLVIAVAIVAVLIFLALWVSFR